MLSLLAVFAVLLLCPRAACGATHTVADTADNAADTGSLRYAVNTAANGDTIDFAANVIGTITLTNGPLAVNTNVTIQGPGAGLLTISGNHAVSVFTLSGGSTVTLSGLTIANGKGSGDHGTDGGGIYGDGTLTVTSCTFSNNSASAFGGAIDLFGTLVVNSSTFSGNSSSGGAAITVNSTTTVNNSTFFDNVGPDGDILIPVPTTSLTVNNSTFSGNSSGSIFNLAGSTVTLTNSILADACNACGTQSANNMIGGAADLGPLQFNGGVQQTMMPLPGSPAIGAGLSSTLATDERGFARPAGNGVASDLGAVQTNYLTVTNLNDSGTGSLRDAITAANSDGSGDIVFQNGVSGTVTLGSILPPITGNVNLSGPGANKLTISGAGTVAVLNIANANAIVNLAGVTITDGWVSGIGTSSVSNSSNNMTVVNSAFTYNQGNDGGAIFNSGGMGVGNTTFSNNSATYGGGIDNQGILVVGNSTFTGNRAYNGNGGGIENSGTAMVVDSTIAGNESLNGGVGAGMDSSSGTLLVANSIVAANMNLNTNTEDDCDNCTQNGPIFIGGNPNLGPLAYNGLNATLQTMLPLPGSPAIQAGNPTQLPAVFTTDERGYPRLTGGKLDLGAAQTNYTSLQFVQQPTNTFFNADISPAVTVEVLETETNLPGPNNTDAVNGVPITLTLNGSGPLGGTLTQTTAGGVASFGNLAITTLGTGDTLATSLTVTPSGVTPAQTLTATSSSFDITLVTQTVSFSPAPPASVTYGTSPIVLSATSSAGLPVTLRVDSGPATISGNMLTITGAGTVVVEADAASNATYAAASATETIMVGLAQSQLALTASAAQAASGSSVVLTATATSSTSGVPTGNVTFLDNGNVLGPVPLNAQGVATLTLTTLPAGPNIITATYPGDMNFLGSQAQLAGSILVGTPGFNMTSSTVSLSVQAGSTGNVTLTLTPTFGYTGTLYFACGGMPGASTCAFQPATLQFDGSGNPVQVAVTMKIATAQFLSRSTKVAKLLPLIPLGGLPMLPAAVLWLPETDDLSEFRIAGVQYEPLNRRSRSHRWIRIAILMLFAMGLLGMLFGCGGQSVTPTGGQYNVTITAAGAGAANQTVAVQLNVIV